MFMLLHIPTGLYVYYTSSMGGKWPGPRAICAVLSPSTLQHSYSPEVFDEIPNIRFWRQYGTEDKEISCTIDEFEIIK